MFKLEHSSMAVLTLWSKSNESNLLKHHRKRNVRSMTSEMTLENNIKKPN